MKPTILSFLSSLMPSVVVVGTLAGWVAPALRENAEVISKQSEAIAQLQKALASMPPAQNVYLEAAPAVTPRCPPPIVIEGIPSDVTSEKPTLAASAQPTLEQLSFYREAQAFIDEAVSVGQIKREREREFHSLVAHLAPQHAEEMLLSFVRRVNEGQIQFEAPP